MADVLVNIVVKKYGLFREGSAARSHVTTRVHSARRSTREPAIIPLRTLGREQPSGPAPGSAPSPNRGLLTPPFAAGTASADQRPAQSAVLRNAPATGSG